jgi:hypothetical protein
MSAVHWIHHRVANWGPAVLGRLAAAVLFGVSLVSATGSAATLEVGPGKPFARIEDANARAQAGDVILVYPRADGQPYQQTAVFVRQARLTFRGVPAEGEQWVKIDGSGFDYSGRGSTPRAIFQFNADTDHCVLEGFELTGAHNGSHNGAGVRINQANHVTVRNCSIHGNDMGIMSNGDGSLERGVNQLIEFCRIHHNGAPADPGYNHNLYLGGTSVTMRACEVHSSLTGHNYKSRAHFNRVEYCYLYHSANREFDLVDAGDTARPGSHTVLLGNIIVKDPECRGNRSVIHFGQDGGRDHDGTLHLRFNTVVTPFMAPVVELSAPGAKAELIGNIVWDAGRRQNGQRLIAVRAGARLENASGGTTGWLVCSRPLTARRWTPPRILSSVSMPRRWPIPRNTISECCRPPPDNWPQRRPPFKPRCPRRPEQRKPAPNRRWLGSIDTRPTSRNAKRGQEWSSGPGGERSRPDAQKPAASALRLTISGCTETRG